MAKHFVISKNPISKKHDKKPQGDNSRHKKIFMIGGMAAALVLISAAVAASFFMLKPQQNAGEVSVKRLGSGDYKLMVNNRPYFIKGICYIPTPIGKGYDYDLWSDDNKPWLEDGRLMKEMGANTVRFYFHSKDAEKGREVINDLYEQFGIRSVLGHYLNFWEYPPPNYGLPEVRARIMQDVIQMVKNYKDSPGILLWVLGNENNYSFDRNVNPWTTEEIEKIQDTAEKRNAKARIYYKFVNELAKEVKRIDPSRPVAMGNGELASIEMARELCTDVDILGGIVYTGRTFGSFWKRLKRNFDKPAIMIEFGCDRYDASKSEETEDYQALFVKTLWEEIEKNAANGSGQGNSLGGFVFEWTDEWWKYNEQYPGGWAEQNTEGSWSNGSYYFDAEAENNMNEEWWGIVGVTTEGAGDIEKRVPKKAYYILKRLWK
ncbi:MAG: glycoside hydrolase family 2 TIM barrel-domain containing protein [Candidatus Omnitrophota bacterium]